MICTFCTKCLSMLKTCTDSIRFLRSPQVWRGLLLAFASLLVSPHAFADGSAGWPLGGQNFGNTRAQNDQSRLTPATAPNLSLKWTQQLFGDVSATPAVVNGAVYVPDWGPWADSANGLWRCGLCGCRLGRRGRSCKPGLYLLPVPGVFLRHQGLDRPDSVDHQDFAGQWRVGWRL